MIDQVPGYRMLERAGEGGFSVVYRAHQQRLDRIVALKVLTVDAVDEATMRRFERECQITGRLTGHPNVVTVLDTGMTAGGRPYISMDYFEHGSLRDRLSHEGPLPVPEVLRIGVKIAGALAATHGAEVLHRDVKPQNILISRYGEPALADFGVARLVDTSESTHSNAFTPHHAAPEVVNGDAAGRDVRRLRARVLHVPAPGGRTGVPHRIGHRHGPLMMRILNEPPPPIPRPDLPPQVFDAIAKAMAKSPGDRFPTAVAFASRLQQVQMELHLPVTELAGAVSLGPPVPPAPDIDHSGFTGPGMDQLIHSFEPHLPVAHPDAPPRPSAPPAPPAPSPAAAAPPPTGAWPAAATSAWPATAPARTAAAPVPAPVRPHETLPPVRHETPEPSDTPPRRPISLAAVAVIVLVVAVGAGVAGLVLSRGDDGKTASPSSPPPPTTSPTSAPPTPASTGVPVPDSVMRAATPRSVHAVGKGELASLSWTLAKGSDYPIMVQQSDETGSQTPQALPKHTVSTTISGLDPAKGYCFTVGAIVALGQSDGQAATIAWSKPACIRGATAQ